MPRPYRREREGSYVSSGALATSPGRTRDEAPTPNPLSRSQQQQPYCRMANHMAADRRRPCGGGPGPSSGGARRHPPNTGAGQRAQSPAPPVPKRHEPRSPCLAWSVRRASPAMRQRKQTETPAPGGDPGRAPHPAPPSGRPGTPTTSRLNDNLRRLQGSFTRPRRLQQRQGACLSPRSFESWRACWPASMAPQHLGAGEQQVRACPVITPPRVDRLDSTHVSARWRATDVRSRALPNAELASPSVA